MKNGKKPDPNRIDEVTIDEERKKTRSKSDPSDRRI